MSASFSADRVYRYVLTRQVGERECNCWIPSLEGAGQHSPGCSVFKERTCLFVCLNPSTADETQDDPTVRRCVRFARDWGYEKLVVCNLFALCSTDPRALYSHDAPEGDPQNLATIEQEARRADLVVAAWGTHGKLRGRGDLVIRALARIAPVHVVGLTAEAHPKHPLYLRADLHPRRLVDRDDLLREDIEKRAW